MDVELVTIGTELLLGFTVDTNGAEIARALGEHGVRVARRTTVPDREPEIHSAVAEALARTGAVVATGGLGPTRDDVTKRAVARIFDAPLEFDPALWSRLVERFARLGRRPAESNRSQAEVPRGATVLPNRNGTAPGLWLEGPPGVAVLLPGVPREMRELMAGEVVPRLAARAREREAARTIRSAVLRTTGIPESTLAERLAEVESTLAPLTLAYLPGLAGVDLRLTAWDLPASEAERRLAEGIARLRTAAGDRAYAEGDEDLAAVVLAAARARGASLAVAESCTGGLVGARLTAVPGSSDTFLGGVVAYHNRVKREQLEVSEAILRAEGAVSAPVAEAMARGALRRLGADLAVGVTGIAGPEGGTPEKPVGLVFLGFAGVGEGGERPPTERLLLFGSREEIRARAAQAALYGLLRRLR